MKFHTVIPKNSLEFLIINSWEFLVISNFISQEYNDGIVFPTVFVLYLKIILRTSYTIGKW